jgi:iron(III) transport system ATP-binding protein
VRPAADDPEQAATLCAAGLWKRFGDVDAVAGVDLVLRSGEIVALVGPSGCGKSTLMRVIAGLLAPDGGTVTIAGRQVSGPRGMVPPERRRTGLVFQDHTLFPHLTVAGNVAFGLAGRPARDVRARVVETLALVDLPGHADRYPHELSGGERQRVALARALAPEPHLVLLDEPFANLDRNLRDRIRTETVDILRKADATVLFVTHDQHEALAVGDRVAVMRAGRLEQVDTPEAAFHAPTSRFVATFLGEADFLPATPRSDSLITEAGPCPLPRGRVPDGGEVMVRPHEVDLTADDRAGARIVGREFRGAFVLYDIRLPSHRRLRSLQPHTVDLPTGTPVAVTLRHGHPPAVLTSATTGPSPS